MQNWGSVPLRSAGTFEAVGLLDDERRHGNSVVPHAMVHSRVHGRADSADCMG